MSVWKIVAIVGAAFVALLGGIFLLVFQLTSGVVDTADDFFASSNEGDYETTYGLIAQDLRRQIPQADLVEYIEFNGFDDVVETSWSSRSVENNTGTISGTVTTQSGSTIPVELTFVLEGEEWKITGISRQDGNFVGPRQAEGQGTSDDMADAAAAADIGENVPADADPQELFQANSRRFVESLVDDGYVFWARHWVEGTNFIQLEQRIPTSSALVEQLSPFVAVEAQLESARMTDAGQMQLVGSSESKNAMLRMTQTFTLENKEWKLADFTYEIE